MDTCDVGEKQGHGRNRVICTQLAGFRVEDPPPDSLTIIMVLWVVRALGTAYNNVSGTKCFRS